MSAQSPPESPAWWKFELSEQLVAAIVWILRLLTIAALIVAILAWRDARIAVESLSTSYLGVFPGYMKDLREKVLETSEESLLIASGLPGYGIYSNHEEYVKYQSAIEQRVKLKVKVIVLNEDGRKEMTEAQFRGADLQRDVRSKPAFRDFLGWSQYTGEQIRDLQAFKTAVLELQKQSLQRDFRDRKIDTVEVPGPMPVFVWIADEKVAVFAIPDLQTPNPEEGAFITYDKGLIKELVSIFRTYEGRTAQKPN